MKRKKVNTRYTGQSFGFAVAIGMVSATMLSLLLLVLLTTLILNGRLREDSMRACVFVIRLISLLTGSLISGSILRKKYLQLIGIIFGGYLLELIGFGIVCYNSSFHHFLSGMVSALIGGISAILILQRPRKTKITSTKYSL